MQIAQNVKKILCKIAINKNQFVRFAQKWDKNLLKFVQNFT